MVTTRSDVESLRAGDIVFVRGHSLIDDGIELVTHSPYSHVAISVGYGQLVEAQGLRRVGVQVATAYMGQADVYRVTWIASKLGEFLGVVGGFVAGHDGYDYGLIGLELLREVFGVDIDGYDEDRHRRLICSTLVAECFRRVGLDPTPGIKYPTPGDEAESKLWRYAFSY